MGGDRQVYRTLYQDGDCSSHDLENNNNINVVPVMNDTYTSSFYSYNKVVTLIRCHRCTDIVKIQSVKSQEGFL